MNHKTISGKTPFQKFNALAKGLIKVPKPELDKKIKEQRARKQQCASQLLQTERKENEISKS
jgi:hypothetical protein